MRAKAQPVHAAFARRRRRDGAAGARGKFISHFLARNETTFFQMMSAQSGRFPELCRLFFNNGRMKVIEQVAGFLEDCKAEGLLSFEDGCLAANQFLSLVMADLPMRVALGLDLPDEEQARKVMEAGVATFLRAFAPDDHRAR